MAQSTDGSRPGDLFSVDQIGQAAGQVLKNNGIYLDTGYLNDVLADVKGGNETGVTSTGDAFDASPCLVVRSPPTTKGREPVR